jgi:predicted CXXCH cytochrome family protein
VENYNVERYPKGFKEDMYTLCFECHDSSLVTGSAEGTEFRNGSKNLHEIHVLGAIKPNKYGIIKRGKARSCSVCHDPHGSSQSHNLIRTYSCEGVFCFTMTYYALEDGGKCMVGCHKQKYYHRKTSSAKSE